MTAVKRWRVERPDGSTFAECNGTRREALFRAFDFMPVGTFHKLDNMDRRVAGWGAIACAGWRVHPAGKPPAPR